MARSTIMDSNSFRPENSQNTPARTLAMIRRREDLLGPAYRLFYEDPVHLVRGEGAYLWDADGAKYLDLYNNVVSVGHANPRVTAAVAAQMGQLNTHTRYLHERILDYAESLLGTMPPELGNVMFTCSGSESNDLALRVADRYTGQRGVIVSAEAYHGNSAATSLISPSLGSGNPVGDHVRLVAAPDAYRVDVPDLGAWFAAQVGEQIDSLERSGHGFSTFIADSLFSSDGVFPAPPGYLQPAIDLVHARGGVFIADEVQPGFARTGLAMWGFQAQGVVPDLITTGKPMGNGIPVAAMAARPEVLEPFASEVPYFNTFGGNPVSIAAAEAVLDIVLTDNLVDHNRVVGRQLLAEFTGLMARHEAIGDVRGSGLYIGIEIVSDRTAKTPDGARALRIVNALRARRVLTSVAGPHSNVLKIRPPFAFAHDDIDWAVSALDFALTATAVGA